MAKKPRAANNGWTIFNNVVRDYKSLLSAGLLLTAVPLAVGQTGIRLPWPEKAEIPTALIQLVALMICFQFLATRTRRSANRTIFLSFVALLVTCGLYVGLLLGFTYKVEDSDKREPRGFFCTRLATVQYKSECPFLGSKELGGVRNNPTDLWTEASIDAVRGSLFLTWLLTFLALPTLVAGFIIFQKRR